MGQLTEIITADQLAEHVGGNPADEWVIASAAAANAAVLTYLGRAYEDGVGAPADPPLPALPPEVFTATLTAGADMYHRRQAPLGISSALDLTGMPLRVTRDWLAGVAPILDRYRDLRQMIG
jgi:hypothetical protein